MAMVRMTVEIIDSVDHKIRNIYDTKLAEFIKANNNPQWPYRVYDHVLGAVAAKVAASGIHADFFTYGSDISFTNIVVPGKTLDLGLTYRFPEIKVQPAARSSDATKPYMSSNSYYGTHYTLYPVDHDADWMVIYNELRSYAEHMYTIKEELRTARDTAKKVMRNNSTVKGAIEDWPALLDLLPPDVVEAHRAPPKPREKKEVTKEQVDTSTLNSLTAHLAMEKLVK
jgi:hypothetical protein